MNKSVTKMREFTRDSSDTDIERKTYRISISETEDKIVETFVTEGKYLYDYKSGYDIVQSHKIGDTFKYYSTTTQQKFLCVNGPLQGTKVTEKNAIEEGYAVFNNANSHHSKGNKELPRVVLIHFP